MTKTNEINLFKFPPTDTLEEYLGNMLPAIQWLEPRIPERSKSLLGEARRLIAELKDAHHSLPHPIIDSKLMLIRGMVDQAKHDADTDTAFTRQEAHSKAQSERASKSRKVDDEQRARIVKRYLAAVADGSSHGYLKVLARDYDVSTKTIDTILRKAGAK